MPVQARVSQAGRLRLIEVEPREPGGGEVLVNVHHCGVCGSDLHWFRGGGVPPTECPGHEASGRVKAVGAGVTAWAEGDRVVVEPLRRCMRCSRCRAGDYHLCDQLGLYGINLPGAMATEMVVPDYCLYPVPDTLDLAPAALAEPLAVTVHACRLGGVGAGSRVLVVGAGTVGLLTIAAARKLGADFVAVSARHEQQRELARLMGADQVLAPEDLVAVQETPDTVVETVGGRASTLADAMFAVDKAGTIVVVGVFEGDPPFNPLVMLVKEVRMVASMTYNRGASGADFDTALALLDERRGDLARLITHHFALEDILHGFETAADKSTGAVKVLVEPGA